MKTKLVKKDWGINLRFKKNSRRMKIILDLKRNIKNNSCIKIYTNICYQTSVLRDSVETGEFQRRNFYYFLRISFKHQATYPLQKWNAIILLFHEEVKFPSHITNKKKFLIYLNCFMLFISLIMYQIKRT